MGEAEPRGQFRPMRSLGRRRDASILHRRLAGVPVGGFLVHAGDAEELLLGQGGSLELQADRQARLGEAAGDADAADAG